MLSSDRAMSAGDRVEVYWAETDRWFPATISAAQTEQALKAERGCVDVIYDELVDGQQVRENNVDAARLRPAPAPSPATPAALTLSEVLSVFLAELEEAMDEGDRAAGEWFHRKPVDERTALLRVASSACGDLPPSLRRFAADVLLPKGIPPIADRKHFAISFAALCATLPPEEIGPGARRKSAALPSAAVSEPFRARLLCGGDGIPLGEAEGVLCAGVLLLDGAQAGSPPALGEEALEAVAGAAAQCISMLQFVVGLPSAPMDTPSTAGGGGDGVVESGPGGADDDGEALGRASPKDKRGRRAGPSPRGERGRESAQLGARVLLNEMAPRWLPLMCDICAKLADLLSRRESTRYLVGSDRLAIVVSRLGLEALRLDPAHSEAGAAIGAAAGEGGALGRLLEGGLGLLRTSFTDNRLIASTLLLDLLPLLLEAYSAPAASPVGQRLPGGLPLPAGLQNTPLATLVLTALIQAAVVPAVECEEPKKSNATARNSDGGDARIAGSVADTALAQGSKLIAGFLSGLLKRCFSAGLTRTGSGGGDPQQYRSLATRLTTDLLRLTEGAVCPAAGVAVDLLLRKSLSELTVHCHLAGGVGEGGTGPCKNVSYVSFLLELVSLVGVHAARQCAATQQSGRVAEETRLPEPTVQALRAMYGLSELPEAAPSSHNAVYLREVIERVRSRGDGTDMSPPRTKRSSAAGPVGEAGEGMLAAETASVLALLADVTAVALDLETQRLPMKNGSEVGAGAVVVPPVWSILAQCGLSSDVLSALGCHEDSALGLSQQAVQGEFVLDQLLHLDYDRAMVHCSAGVACAQGHFAAGLVSDAVALFLQLQLRNLNRTTSSRRSGGPTVHPASPSGMASLMAGRLADHCSLRTAAPGVVGFQSTARARREQVYQEHSWRACYSAAFIRRCHRDLQVHFYAQTGLDQALGLLCVLLGQQPSPQVRARVLKVLAAVIKADPGVFTRPGVRAAVCERFNDSFISVREEAIKLVALGVMQEETAAGGEDAVSWFLDGLLVRLRDKGVSVRKTVVHLLTAVLSQQPGHPRYSQICQCLLEVAALPQEEASVKEIIKIALHRVWFSAPPRKTVPAATAPSSVAGRLDVEGASVAPVVNTYLLDALNTGNDGGVPPDHVEMQGKSEEVGYVDLAALQIVDVVCRSGNDPTWLVSLLRDVLHGGASLRPVEEKEAGRQRRSEAWEHCDRLLASLREALIRTEEAHGPTVRRLEALHRPGGSQVLAIITAMAAFCEAHPPFLMPHLDSLLPYLKASASSDPTPSSSSADLSPPQLARVTLLVLTMVAAAVPVEGKAFYDSSDDLGQDLWRICLAGSAENVGAAARCLALLARHTTHDLGRLESLAKKCLEAVCTMARQRGAPTPRQMGLLQRSVIVLGAVCEQTDNILAASTGEGADPQDNERIAGLAERLARADIATYTISAVSVILPTLCGATYAAVRLLLSTRMPADELLRKRAAQALCSVFVGCPPLIILAQEEGLLQGLLSAERSPAVQELFLVSLARMMAVEERRLETLAAGEAMRRAGLSVNRLGYSNDGGDGDGEGGPRSAVAGSDAGSALTGSVLQQHLPRVCAFFGHPLEELRLAAVDLIDTLLRQGMLCPLDVISPLVGLQGDGSEEVRRRALMVIQLEDTKHGNFLDNRLCEGVEAVPELQRQSYRRSWATSPAVSGLPPVSVVGPLYASCFRANRKRRADCLTALLRRCEAHCNLTGGSTHPTMAKGVGSTPSPGAPRGECRATVVDLNVSRVEEKVHFLSTTLAYLPFNVLDEVLLVVSWLNRNSTVQTEVFLQRFRTLLLVSGAAARREGAMQAPLAGCLGPRRVVASPLVSSSPAPLLCSDNGQQQPRAPTPAPVDVGRIDSCMFEETLVFDEEAFMSRMQQTDSSADSIQSLRCHSGEARCRERLILLKHFLKYAYGLSTATCVAYASDGKALDKTRRPKKRPSRAAKSAPVLAVVESVGPTGGGAGSPTTAGDGAATGRAAGWESSVSFCDFGIQHPYESLLPPIGDPKTDGGHGSSSGGGWTDADHTPLGDIDAARTAVRRAVDDFNRLLTLQFNGFEHHPNKDNSTSKRARHTAAALFPPQTKTAKKLPKRKRLQFSDGAGSDEDGFGDVPFDDDDEDYVP